MHLLPQLRRLEESYADVLTVVGVHSPKFTTERETESLRRAVQRHNIQHPVVNDRDYTIWQSYAVRAWPTLMFIDPRGYVIGKHEGEISYQSLAQVMEKLVAEFDSQKLIERRRILFPVERDKAPEDGLAFPGKVLADEAAGRLFIADSGHHRIVVAGLDGEVKSVVGSGQPGFADGSFSSARFNSPQGMALVGEALYVADTEGHAVRRVDIKRGRVETVAGTGQQATAFGRGGSALQTALSSPWDVAYHAGKLYVAMSGMHQLWALEVASGVIRPFAGSGREGLADDVLAEAWLAQPSGLATDGRTLYFADSETSSIRAADLGADGRVRTLVGLDLFVFGDADGSGPNARLQHPLGLCLAGGQLFVADTYNNKVKRLDLREGRLETLAGTGQPGLFDGPAADSQLFEPGGLSATRGVLYIADTNNHVVRALDLATRHVSTLVLRGLLGT